MSTAAAVVRAECVAAALAEEAGAVAHRFGIRGGLAADERRLRRHS